MSDEATAKEIDEFLKIFGTSLRHYSLNGVREKAVAAWRGRTPDPALSALREARDIIEGARYYVNDAQLERIKDFDHRIDAHLSTPSAPDPRVVELVRAAREAAYWLKDRADADHNGVSFIANDEMRLADELEAALTPFKDIPNE